MTSFVDSNGRFCCFVLPQQKTKSGGSKKPLTGFMLFSKEHREKVKEDNPEITFGQIGKKLGAMWRELSDDEKQAYKDGKSGAAAEKE